MKVEITDSPRLLFLTSESDEEWKKIYEWRERLPVHHRECRDKLSLCVFRQDAPKEEPAVEWTAEDIRNAFAALTKDTDDSSLSKLLDKWAAIPIRTSLKVGDVVRLKSGGPAMTVVGFDEKQGWDCSYMVKGERHPVGGYFPEAALEAARPD